MKATRNNLPNVVDREQWLTERKMLLKKEKELTRHRDAVNMERRNLPMVKVEKQYRFEGPQGEVSMADLFEGRTQLVVYHFMFAPEWEEGCPSCSLTVDSIGHLSHLYARDTTLVLISRAPLQKLEKYRKRMGWDVPWYSSYGSDFNYDFHVSIDPSLGSDEYNYQKVQDLGESWIGWKGEQPGVSTFLHSEGEIFHNYSSYYRGTDLLINTFNYLDLTVLGRQEDWEKPAGRSDSKAMGWVRRHDAYD